MSKYKLYTSERPHKKFRAFFNAGVDHDAASYHNALAAGQEPTALQQRSFDLKSQRDAAVSAYEEKIEAAASAAAKRRETNHACEKMMGLRNDDRLPFRLQGNDEAASTARQLLGRQPSSASRRSAAHQAFSTLQQMSPVELDFAAAPVLAAPHVAAAAPVPAPAAAPVSIPAAAAAASTVATPARQQLRTQTMLVVPALAYICPTAAAQVQTDLERVVPNKSGASLKPLP